MKGIQLKVNVNPSLLADPEVAKVYEALGLIGSKVDEVEAAKTNEAELAKIGITPEQAKALSTLGIKTNANEVMHTTQTGYGKELVPVNQLANEILDLVPAQSTFLSMLPGNHGTSMGKSVKVPLLGDPGLFSGNSEWTTGAGAIGQGNTKAPTQEVLVSQGSFIKSIDVSKSLLTYSVGDLETKLKQSIATAVGYTVDAIVINGDSTSGATGNVNLDDAAPASTNYYMQVDGGIRKTALAGTTVDVGTMDVADVLAVQKLHGDLYSDPSQFMLIFNPTTYQTALGIDSFADAAKRGEKSTVAGNAITSINGEDVFTTRFLAKTEADGKISTTAGNNTLGQFVSVYKPAVQYGFGQTLELDVVKVPGKGISIIATFEFGFGIASSITGITGQTCVMARNVTV